jgi:hypothetical protein
MKYWKPKEQPKRHDIFSSEIRLKNCAKSRENKVKKLIKLLGGSDIETVS